MFLIGKAGGSMGFSAIYVYSGELYPTEVRTVGMGTSSMCARFSGMAAPYVGGPVVRPFTLIYTIHIYLSNFALILSSLHMRKLDKQ